jgi:hypothetical protein
MQSLTVYNPLHEKVRIGNKYDGGYVIVDKIGEYDLFLSGGINNDISFEVDFLNRHLSLKGIAFDGTISNIPNHSLKNRLQFVKKNIGYHETTSVTNLHAYLNSHSNIFMKMDIEGGEYPFLASVSDEQLTHIKQLVIEFHDSTNLDITTRLAKTHWLVHIHANNALRGRGTFHGKTFVPAVYECTYVRKDIYVDLRQNSDPVPNPAIDSPNIPRSPDVYLNMLPYTTHTVHRQQIYRKQKLWGL